MTPETSLFGQIDQILTVHYSERATEDLSELSEEFKLDFSSYPSVRSFIEDETITCICIRNNNSVDMFSKDLGHETVTSWTPLSIGRLVLNMTRLAAEEDYQEDVDIVQANYFEGNIEPLAILLSKYFGLPLETAVAVLMTAPRTDQVKLLGI